MKIVLSMLFILILNTQAMHAQIASFSLYNGSFRFSTQHYHYPYMYSKIGLDFQTYNNEREIQYWPYLYISLGLPVMEASLRFPIGNSYWQNRPSENTPALSWNLEMAHKDMIYGTFFEMQNNPELLSLGFSVKKVFGEKRNNKRSNSMNQLNKYGIYGILGSVLIMTTYGLYTILTSDMAFGH